MNELAVQRWQSWGLESHEIYGVSGVRTNRWTRAPLPPPEPVTGTHGDGAVVGSSVRGRRQPPLRGRGPAEATRIRLVFSKISTEQDYDHVEVFAVPAGQRIARYSGEMGAVTTAEIPGNRAEIRLTSTARSPDTASTSSPSSAVVPR